MRILLPSPKVRYSTILVLCIVCTVALIESATSSAQTDRSNAGAEARQKSSAQSDLLERLISADAATKKSSIGSSTVIPSQVKAGANLLVPTIAATMVDTIFTDVDGDGRADPGDTLQYTVVITNTGTDATAVNFNDTIDSRTTLVPGSVNSSPIAFDDPGYTAAGNVRITISAASGVLANDIDPDTGNNTGLTASAGATSANGGNVAMSANGGFSYNPAPGFTGTDTFTYTVTDAGGATGTGTVTFNVSGMIWFINAAAGGGGDGRLTTPFNCFVGAGCYNGSANDPGDNIFLYSGAYTGGLTLKANQRVIGQGAGASLSTITGITPPTGSDALPSTGGARPTVTSVAAATSALTLAAGNTLRGFDIGNTTAADITGTSFGTLTVVEVTLSGTGRALDLNTGTLSATFDSITSTSSSTQGIVLQTVGGALTVSGGTTISGATTQGILVSTSTVNTSFGNTSISAGTDGVSLQNNSSGTRTFGTLSTTNGSGVGFLHAVGGGLTSITGAATFTNPGTNCVNIQDSTTAVTFGNVNCTQSGGTGVFIDDNTAGGTVTFSDLDISPDSGQRCFHATDNLGTITTTSGTISPTGTAIPIEIVGLSLASLQPLNIQFTSVSANGASSGIILTRTSLSGAPGGFNIVGDGTMTAGGNASGGTIQNTTGDAIVLNSASNVTLRNMTITNPLGHGVNADNLTGVNLFQSLTVQNFDTLNTDGITVDQTVNFTSITLDKSLFTDAGAHGGNDAFRFVALSGNSAAGTVNVTASEFTELDGDGIQINNDGSGTINTTITGNNLHTADTTGGGNFNTLSVNLTGNGVLNATIGGAGALGNTLNDVARVSANAGALSVAAVGPAALSGCDLNATIENNTITNIPNRRGINVQLEASAANHTLGHDITIKDNNIQNTVNRQGIYVAIVGIVGFDNQNVDLSITGNLVGTVTPVGNSARPGIHIQVFDDFATAGTVLETDILLQNNQVRVNNTGDVVRIETGAGIAGGTANVETTMLGNTFTNDNAGGLGFNAEVGFFVAGTNTFSLDMNSANVVANRNTSNRGYVLNHDKTMNAATDFNVEVQAGDPVVNTAGATYSDAQIETFFSARNTGTVTTPANSNDFTGVASVMLPLAFVDDEVPATVIVPSEEDAVSEDERNVIHEFDNKLRFPIGSYQTPSEMLVRIRTLFKHFVKAETVSNKDTHPSESGSSISLLDDPQWQPMHFASLNNRATSGSKDSEKPMLNHARRQDGRRNSSIVDAQAQDHTAQEGKPHDGSVKPATNEAEPVREPGKDGNPDSGETITVNGGGPGFTLPAGKSITIRFRVTIDNVQPAVTQVSNQGTVSGSNFANVLTDDPNVGGAANPTVRLVDNTTVAVTTSGTPTVFGQNVTFTATMTGVPSRASDPPGTVQFKADGNNIGAAVPVVIGAVGDNVSTAQASTTTLSTGSHVIAAVYSGGGAGATGYNSNTGTLSGGQVVNKANTSVGLTSSQNPAPLGTNLTFTATISVTAPGAGTVSGTVQFLDGVTPITGCTAVAVAAGQAQCMTTALTVGSHTISAVYSGDTNFNTSTGNLTGNPQVITGPPTITPTVGLSRRQGSPATNSQIATVTDDVGSPGSIVVTAMTVPANMTITNIVNTNGNITADLAAGCAAATGNNVIVLKATDGKTLNMTGNLTINVLANTAPTLGNYANSTVVTGCKLILTPDAAPGDNGSVASVMASGGGGFTGTIGVNATTGVVTITNNGPVGGPFTITVTATDNCGTTFQRMFTVTVNNPPTAPTEFDFDGDRKADIAVYRGGATASDPSFWYILRSSDNMFQPIQFGADSDVIVPGDYNGDGTTDVGVYRPSTNTWFTSTNPATNYGAFQWGVAGDIPVPGQYDADNKTDIAVFRPSNGNWYIAKSTGGSEVRNWGQSGDKPIPADVDGDGKTDLVQYRESSFTFFIQKSGGGTVVQSWGTTGDKLVLADYDGDNKDDIAVFRPSNNFWYILQSTGGTRTEQFGQAGDVPIPADYDNDGKADLAVYRPGTGSWVIFKSCPCTPATTQFGISTDRAIPSAFTP